MHNTTINTVCLIISAILFALAAFNTPSSKVNLHSLGEFFFVLSFLI